MRESRLIRQIIPLALVAFVWAGLHAPAHAQATRGTILGTITDQSGAAMPGVNVVATETRTNLSHDTVTNGTGNYTFPNIPDGIYNIKAELQGFKTVVREAIRLAVNTSIRVDFALPVGELAETVTVSMASAGGMRIVSSPVRWLLSRPSICTLLASPDCPFTSILRLSCGLKNSECSRCGRVEPGTVAIMPWKFRLNASGMEAT